MRDYNARYPLITVPNPYYCGVLCHPPSEDLSGKSTPKTKMKITTSNTQILITKIKDFVEYKKGDSSLIIERRKEKNVARKN